MKKKTIAAATRAPTMKAPIPTPTAAPVDTVLEFGFGVSGAVELGEFDESGGVDGSGGVDEVSVVDESDGFDLGDTTCRATIILLRSYAITLGSYLNIKTLL